MALILPYFFDCVVAIGVKRQDGTTYWIATGFLFGNYALTEQNGEKKYNLFFVTNKHVLKDQTEVVIRFNPQDDKPSRDYPVSLTDENGKSIWAGHPDDNIDIAVIKIDADVLKNDGIKYFFFTSDDFAFTIEKLIENQVTEGDFIYVLGFPMGLVDQERQYVILRSGTIARIRDLYDKRSKDFVIDALVFPGNSGGPVVLKPELVGIRGTKSNKKSVLIGVIKSYIPYRDVAVSEQTGQPRIIFEDNSGLSVVEPVDHIIETIISLQTK